jgi:RNA polymerase sigma-70 factor, ECF subfamily
VTDEQRLVQQAREGSLDAFRELVDRSKRNVYLLAYHMTGSHHDAEDCSQDVFIKAYRSLPAFRGDAQWNTWIHRITINTCLDHRKARKEPMSEFNEEEGMHESRGPAGFTQPDNAAEGGMIRENIGRALDRLSPSERSVFVLRHFHDMTLKQIAGMLELAEGTVKSHLFRAIQRLQKELSFYREDAG